MSQASLIESYLRMIAAAAEERAARALRLDKLLRLKVLPPVLGPPFGVTILDLPARFPLPAKITIRVLQPVDLRERLGADPDPDEAYRLVTGTMERSLTPAGQPPQGAGRRLTSTLERR
jgi:hypothetical protein